MNIFVYENSPEIARACACEWSSRSRRVSRTVRESESGCTRCRGGGVEADRAAAGGEAAAARDRPPDDARPCPACCHSRSPTASVTSNAPVMTKNRWKNGILKIDSLRLNEKCVPRATFSYIIPNNSNDNCLGIFLYHISIF